MQKVFQGFGMYICGLRCRLYYKQKGVVRKNEDHVDWNIVFAFAWGHMAALNTEIRLWGL